MFKDKSLINYNGLWGIVLCNMGNEEYIIGIPFGEFERLLIDNIIYFEDIIDIPEVNACIRGVIDIFPTGHVISSFNIDDVYGKRYNSINKFKIFKVASTQIRKKTGNNWPIMTSRYFTNLSKTMNRIYLEEKEKQVKSYTIGI